MDKLATGLIKITTFRCVTKGVWDLLVSFILLESALPLSQQILRSTVEGREGGREVRGGSPINTISNFGDRRRSATQSYFLPPCRRSSTPPPLHSFPAAAAADPIDTERLEATARCQQSAAIPQVRTPPPSEAIHKITGDE